MTCIKTGCNVYFINYGCRVRADLYNIAGVTVIKWNPNSVEYLPDHDGSDYAVSHWQGDEVWYRDDLATAVVPADYFWKL